MFECLNFLFLNFAILQYGNQGTIFKNNLTFLQYGGYF